FAQSSLTFSFSFVRLVRLTRNHYGSFLSGLDAQEGLHVKTSRVILSCLTRNQHLSGVNLLCRCQASGVSLGQEQKKCPVARDYRSGSGAGVDSTLCYC